MLDTHVLLWWQAGGKRLSRDARRVVERADRLGVSAVSVWEVGMLQGKGRVALDRDLLAWVRDLSEDRVEVVPLSASAAATAALLGDVFPGDPADRLIYATARELRAPLVTKDERLHRFAASASDVRTVW